MLDGAATGALTGSITGALTGGISNGINGVCFVAGTTVLTSTGFVLIEDISIGDMVWSENPETGDKELKEVVQTFVNETNELVHVYVNGEEIITTPEHPFYVNGKGWIIAGELYIGDMLILQNGNRIPIEELKYETLEISTQVYNFEVKDFHTYYVSNNCVLVHNVCLKSQAKKIDPLRLENEFNLPSGTFHREIKQTILNKVKPSYSVGKNADILIDRAKNIAYQGVNGKGFQDTGLNMINIIKELK